MVTTNLQTQTHFGMALKAAKPGYSNQFSTAMKPGVTTTSFSSSASRPALQTNQKFGDFGCFTVPLAACCALPIILTATCCGLGFMALKNIGGGASEEG